MVWEILVVLKKFTKLREAEDNRHKKGHIFFIFRVSYTFEGGSPGLVNTGLITYLCVKA